MQGAENEAALIELWVPIKEYAERTGKNVNTITTQVYRRKRESRKGMWNGEETLLVQMNPAEALGAIPKDTSELVERIDALKSEIEGLKVERARLESQQTFSEKEKAFIENAFASEKTLLQEVVVSLKDSLHSKQQAIEALQVSAALQRENRQLVITTQEVRPWLKGLLSLFKK